MLMQKTSPRSRQEASCPYCIPAGGPALSPAQEACSLHILLTNVSKIHYGILRQSAAHQRPVQGQALSKARQAKLKECLAHDAG